MENFTEYTRLFTALVVIVDPFMAIPILLSLTHNHSITERNKIARVTAITVATVLLISAFLGETLLGWMGTSLASFRVGGGIVHFFDVASHVTGGSRECQNYTSGNLH